MLSKLAKSKSTVAANVTGYSEKSLMESVVDFFSDVVPQAYTGSPHIDDKEKIQWVRFEDCDSNDIAKNPDLFKSDTKGLPLLLILGYSNGVQIWYITPNGEAQEIMSVRQGPVRLCRVLPTPDSVLGHSDTYTSKRPLVVMCDSSSAGQPYCSVKFVSLKTGDEVHCINYKTLTVQNVECNKRFLVTVFHEKVCVYDSCQFKQLFWITSCYPCPGQKVNPIALSTRWLAYADKRLVPMHQSCGGMSGDGSQSYAATVISAAKGAFKGLSMFGEAMGSYVTGNKTYTTKKIDTGIVDNGDRPGIVSVVDLQNVHNEHFNVNEDNEGDGLIAHFHAHANEPVANMAFDSSGTLLVTACKLGHNFHVFRLMAHPCNSSLGAVHHLYTLHRGDTTARVIDIGFNHDSRWVTVSTHRGTTHLFPITPYGGSVSVRTHCQPHVVNRASRFHKSAGLDEIEHNPVGRRSPVLSSSPGSSGQYDRYPSLIQQNTLNNNMGNPRLPPYPHPITVYPSYQIKQPLNISMNPGNKNSSPTHSPTGVDNIFSVAARFSTSRMCVVGSPKLGMERRETGKRPVDSLFILAQSGTLVEYILEPRARPSSEKVTDESQLDLGVTGRVQWNLQRQKNSPEQRPPLPSNSPLILAREAVATGIPTAPDLFDLPGLTRHESKESLSSDHSGKDDSDEQWVSQVEIITHAGPHRRLWMGPQFSFKTYQNTTVLSSNSSALLSQSPESAMAAMDLAGDEGDLESLKVQPARSNPVTMPTARPAYRRLSGSDSSPTPSKGGQSTPLMIEAGSYEQSPHLCDVYSNWTESTVAKQPHLSDELEEDQLKETLADAMVESPVKDAGKGIVKQEITRSESTKSEVERGSAQKENEREENKKQKGKKKKPSPGKSDKLVDVKETENADGKDKELVKKEEENKKKNKKEIEADKRKEKDLVKKEKDLQEKGDKQKGKTDQQIAGKTEKDKDAKGTAVHKTVSDSSVKDSGSRRNQGERNRTETPEKVKSKSDLDSIMLGNIDSSNLKNYENKDDQPWSKSGKKKNKSGMKVSNRTEDIHVSPSGSAEDTDMCAVGNLPDKAKNNCSLKEVKDIKATSSKNLCEYESISVNTQNKFDSQSRKADKREIKEQHKSLFESIKTSKKETKSSKDNKEHRNTENVIETVRSSASRSEDNSQLPPKLEVSDSVIPDKSNLSISNITSKSESEHEGKSLLSGQQEKLSDEQEKLNVTDVDSIEQEETTTQRANKDKSRDNESELLKENVTNIPYASADEQYVADKTETSKDIPEMEESMYESMMEMSIADLPSKTSSGDKVAQGGEKEGFQMAGGKNKKKRRKNKKTSDNDLFGGSNDNISISSGSSAGMVMNRQAEQLLDNVFSMAGESTDSN